MAYESDLTKFMREYLKEHPEEVASQKKGRLIWWDKDPSVRTPPPPPRRQFYVTPGGRIMFDLPF